MNMPILLKENKKILSHLYGPKRLYFDVRLSIAFQRPVLDYWKFDDFIHEIYGDYEEELGLSMYDLLVKEKGVDFAEYIKGLI